MLKASVFGFGNIGHGMTKLLREKGVAEVIGVCDIDEKKLSQAREMGLKATQKPRELCSWDVDFVIVCSTNYAHHEHVLAAAEAGRHIFCEKPPALTLAQLDEMIAATDKHKCITAVNYGRRFHPASQRMKQMVDSGELGRILSVTSYVGRGWGLAISGNPHPAVAHPELSGGWLVHHACHTIDYVVSLLGGVKTAYCRSNTTMEKVDSPEVLWGIMEHASGAIGVVGDSVGTMRQGGTSIIGTKGTVELSHTPAGEALTLRRETGKEFPYFVDTLGAAPAKYHESTMGEFIACIKAGRKFPTDLRSTRESLVAILALEESRRTNKIVQAKDMEAGK